MRFSASSQGRSQAPPAFRPQAAEILLCPVNGRQQGVLILIQRPPEIQIVAGMVHAEHAAGAVKVLHKQLRFLQHLMLIQQAEALPPDPARPDR